MFEPSNAHNANAIQLVALGEQLGWIPDWLVNDVHSLVENHSVRVYGERVNLDAPSRLRVLCRLEALTAYYQGELDDYGPARPHN